MAVQSSPSTRDTGTEVTVRQSPWKLLARTLGSLAFVVLCAAIVLPGGWFADLPYPDIVVFIARIVCLFGIFFFGAASLFFLSTIPRWKEPIIVINEDGLLDRSSALSAGMLFWDDIESIDKTHFFGQPTLSIKLTDPDAYLSDVNTLKQIPMRINTRLIGTPVAIAEGSIPIPLEELLTHIHQYQKRAEDSS